MKHTQILIAALLASACSVDTSPDNGLANESQANMAKPSTPTPVAPVPQASAPDQNSATPAPTPPAGDPGPTPPALTQPAAAVAVLQAYCDAIAHKDYRTAYRQWGGVGEASGLTYAQFVDAYAKYDAYDCSFSAPLDQEGAAGSIYLTVPAVVTGTLTKGGGFTLRGPITMRRVNDVDGSTAEQRHWHIATSGLKPRP